MQRLYKWRAKMKTLWVHEQHVIDERFVGGAGCHREKLAKQAIMDDRVCSITNSQTGCIVAAKGAAHLELVALAEDVLDVRHAVVADLADVQQAVEAADVDEGAVGLHGLDGAHHNIAHLGTSNAMLSATERKTRAEMSRTVAARAQTLGDLMTCVRASSFVAKMSC